LFDMGVYLKTAGGAVAPSSSSIQPPKAVTGLMGGDYQQIMWAKNLPLPVINIGDFITVPLNGPVVLTSNQNAVIWSTTAAPFFPTATNVYILCFYWDKVDAKIYVLAMDGVSKLQLSWLDPITGGVTLLGAAWIPTAIFLSTAQSGYSMTRPLGQGVGDFNIDFSIYTGMGALVIPVTGGSATETLNVQVGGNNPKVVASYKVASNLYIGEIHARDTYVINGSMSYYDASQQAIALVTDKVQSIKIIHNSAAPFGVDGSGGIGYASCNVIEWGGDIAVLGYNSNVRIGATLFDKADFHRWVKEIANLHCGGTF